MKAEIEKKLYPNKNRNQAVMTPTSKSRLSFCAYYK